MGGRLMVLTLALLGACTASAPADDAAPGDAGRDAPRVDLGPCGGGCGAGQACCPSGLTMACLHLLPSGECPLPDLSIDGPRAGASARLVWHRFEPSDCAIAEGCVMAPGLRRLLRFETFTPNIGTGDMHLGVPSARSPNFVYSMCHMHYHFVGYADYRLDDASGAQVAEGHKQAFCLLDSERVIDDPSVPTTERYSCLDQGIQRGWGDDYYAGLPCQWIDVTDVAPGDYTLHVEINGMRALAEISYENNVADVSVTITDPAAAIDPLAPCASTLDGPRECGWTVAAAFDCVAGSTVDVGCGSACHLGSCSGESMMRVCPGDAPCASHDELGFADEGCGSFLTAGRCPMTSVTCPPEGRVTVLTAPYVVGDATSACVPAAG